MTLSFIVEHHSSLDLFLLKHSFNSIFSFFLIISCFFKECFKASFFIAEDNDSFAEIITSFMTIKALKKWCKELKAKLQARKIILSSSIYFERSRFQKILDSSLFIDEKNSIWKNWYEKVQNKLKINVDLFSSEQVKLSYVHFRLFNAAAEIIQSRCKRDCFNLYKIIDELLKELAQLFNDSDKEVNFHRNYYNLIQEQKKFSEFYTQFQQLASTASKKNFSMFSVKTASFHALIKWSKKNCIEIFVMSIKDIDRKIVYNTQCELNVLDVAFIIASAQNLEDIKVKLFLKYQNFLDVFDRAQVDKLSSHSSYNHKIELINNVTSFKCRAYWMSFYKFQKIKEYLNENLSKNFITSSKISYFSLVLFALKINDDFRFCVNYWKLNVIIKRNHYSLSLINEMIDKIINCKHLTWLNIIFAFNKLYMHLNNENYTIFIITLEAYKSKILLRVYQDWLKLINDLVEIWSRSDSDLTQIWLNILFLS